MQCLLNFLALSKLPNTILNLGKGQIEKTLSPVKYLYIHNLKISSSSSQLMDSKESFHKIDGLKFSVAHREDNGCHGNIGKSSEDFSDCPGHMLSNNTDFFAVKLLNDKDCTDCPSDISMTKKSSADSDFFSMILIYKHLDDLDSTGSL